MCVAYALIVFVVCFHCSWRWVRLFIACYSLYVDCWMCRCLSFCFVTFVFIIVCVSNFSWCLIPPYIEALNKRHIHSQDDVMECLWVQFKLPAFACFSPNAPCRCCMGLWLDENSNDQSSCNPNAPWRCCVGLSLDDNLNRQSSCSPNAPCIWCMGISR